MLGDGAEIRATKDQWLPSKRNFRVDNDHRYAGRVERVEELFIPSTKTWDESKIRGMFTETDASAILALRVPQRHVSDRLAWTLSIDGIFSVKTGYQHWLNRSGDLSECVSQSGGWKRIWKLKVPHKMKVFL